MGNPHLYAILCSMSIVVTGANNLHACELAAEISLYSDILEKSSGRVRMDLAALMMCSLAWKKWTRARMSLGREIGR